MQRHYFTNKGPFCQSYGFFSSHVWMWESNYNESWVAKNWCSQTVVLEKTFESPLDCKEIQPVHPKGNQSWIFIERTDAETLNTLATWCKELTHWKRPWCWEGLAAGGEGYNREWLHHRPDGHEFELALGVGNGQGGLVCCSPSGCRESDTTEQLNWTNPDLASTSQILKFEGSHRWSWRIVFRKPTWKIPTDWPKSSTDCGHSGWWALT